LTGIIFHSVNSAYTDPDDNNEHYSNYTCMINLSFVSYKGVNDDEYHALGNCTFNLHYYTDPGNWNCTLTVNNSYRFNVSNSTSQTVNELLALELPGSINYGTVNATYVSDENITNVSNAGNVKINLSLKGWAVNQGDGQAMNCTQGSIKNIYTNLSSTPVIKKFELDYRHQDGYNEAINSTYWRIYVPLGVAGSCQGNIQFGATKSAGS
jgi:hypothetical protein